MAIIKCPYCGESTTSSSPTCLNCGNEIDTTTAEPAHKKQEESPNTPKENPKKQTINALDDFSKEYVEIENYVPDICDKLSGISIFIIVCIFIDIAAGFVLFSQSKTGGGIICIYVLISLLIMLFALKVSYHLILNTCKTMLYNKLQTKIQIKEHNNK